MDSEAYWAKRAEKREQLWNKKAKSTIEKELAEYYRQAFSAIEEDIAALYGRFAKDNKLNYRDAAKLLTGSEYSQWRMSMEEYLAKIKGEKDPLLTELNTLAMRKRISRLDKLRAETLKELRKLAGRADLNVEKFLGDAYKDNYYKNLYDIGQKASILSSVAEVDSEKLKKVIYAPWSGKNYSERLWKNTNKLSQLIKHEITDGIHRGTSLQKLASLIRQRMDVGQYEATRLVRTEMNYTQNQAALDSIKDSGMKYYTFIATLDRRTSAICRAHDRKTYPASEAQPGKNMPPLHPNCRSTISGSLKSTGRIKGTRTGKDAEGKRITVPASMIYEDFKKIYIDKSMTMQEWEKTQQKTSKDAIIKEKTWPTLSEKLGDNDLTSIKQALEKSPLVVQKVWNKYVDRFNILDYNLPLDQTAHYSPWDNGVRFNLTKISQDEYITLEGRSKEVMTKANGTLFHELGHHISGLWCIDNGYKFSDIALKWMDARGITLNDMLKQETKEYVDKRWKQEKDKEKERAEKAGIPVAKVLKSSVYRLISSELCNKSVLEIGDVSDMMGGATKNKAVDHMGHSDSYWKKMQPGVEAFAEMFDATINNPDSLKQIQIYFPKSYQLFLDILTDIAE